MPADDLGESIGADEAWDMATHALHAFLPQLAETVASTSKDTPRRLTVDGETRDRGIRLRPYTYHGDRRSPPFVRCDYRGRPGDILDIAHELAHAVQLAASDGAPMPPVAREVCAFLGEAALIGWVDTHRPHLSRALKSAWRASSATHLIRDGDRLFRALLSNAEDYDYRWNYPIARMMASTLLSDASQEDIAALFCGGPCAPAMLARYPVRSAPAVLPPLPWEDRPANAYRHAGAIALLDIRNDHANGDHAIGARQADLVRHMERQSIFIALDADGAPEGYATWEQDDADPQPRAVGICPQPGGVEMIAGAQGSAVPRTQTSQVQYRKPSVSERRAAVELDLYASIGFAFELLSRSDYHRAFRTSAYLAVEMLPAINRDQVRFYLTEDDIPLGMVTWAWLDEAVEAEVLATGRALRPHEWNSGPRFFINDFIAPYGNARAIVSDLRRQGFVSERVSGIRRHSDGRMRCVKNSRVKPARPSAGPAKP